MPPYFEPDTETKQLNYGRIIRWFTAGNLGRFQSIYLSPRYLLALRLAGEQRSRCSLFSTLAPSDSGRERYILVEQL
jgi:hypothetical protein